MENNPKSENRLLFSYLLYPNIKFESYEPGEKIILLLRSHPFTQIGWVFNSIVLFFVLIFINFIIPSFFTFNKIFIINCFFLVFIASFIWINILNWYFNVGIITNKRVIDIDYSGVIYKEITSTILDRIEDITVKSGGYFESIFDYGTIYIQTAGKENYIEFFDIPYPSQVIQKINKLLSKKHGV